MKPQVKILLGGMVLIIVLFGIPLNYYVIAPGPVFSGERLVATKAVEERPHIYAPSVKLYEMRLFSLWDSQRFNKFNTNVFYFVYGKVHPGIDVNTMDEFLERGITSDEFERVMASLTQGSIDDIKAYVAATLGIPEEKLDIDITLDGEGSSVSSALALEAVNQLGKEELTKGRKVAAVGKIDMHGNVYPVGAERYKVAAADHAGMDIIFVSDQTDRAALEAVSTSVQVVQVTSVDDAIQYLEGP